ncbi:UDP-N-acetylmuramoyl-L-alanine--D-glutamate ligase [Candidatus Parcubacteria bacterium]|nr:UDP-N-acetylmuramoyl-L-alanine--D-glutamate ligase [Candidatus Parcubacteria bacterium]
MSSLQRKYKKLQNKKICILGFGIENQALVEFLLNRKIDCEITICDAQENIVGTRRGTFSHNKNIEWRLGENYDKNLDKFDIIFRIAGYPLFSPEIKKAKKFGVEISSPIKLFFELCPTKNIIGVTGTKGKGTTSSLIYEILKSSAGTERCPIPARDNPNIYIGGNIGIPVFNFFEKIKKDDYVILELSSFQLEDLQINPKVAVITNFSREHLKPADPHNPNYHKTLENYWQAKFNIIRSQTKNNFAIINKDLKLKVENSFKNILSVNGKKIYFYKSNLNSQLIGEHNKKNIAAAFEAAKVLKINKKYIVKAIANFKGLEYRLEFIAKKNSMDFYNDSFATTPESTITALKSFDCPIILIAGGADKGNDFKEMAKAIKQKVKFLILFAGKGSIRLKNRLHKISFSDNKICMANNMSEAIKTALAKADSGDVVLLSPGCASFGVFKNYKERGRSFKDAVGRM